MVIVQPGSRRYCLESMFFASKVACDLVSKQPRWTVNTQAGVATRPDYSLRGILDRYLPVERAIMTCITWTRYHGRT